jgi:hypothetical protein
MLADLANASERSFWHDDDFAIPSAVKERTAPGIAEPRNRIHSIAGPANFFGTGKTLTRILWANQQFTDAHTVFFTDPGEPVPWYIESYRVNRLPKRTEHCA